MKKVIIIIVTILVVIALAVGYGVSINNSLVNAHEEINEKVSNISVQLERRADLIPNLVNTVKGYTDHENEVLDKITEARASILSAKSFGEKIAANEELSNALNSLNIIVENYPELKSSENFINLQDELAGTENRISTARMDFNNAVKDYNKKVKSFPTNIIASIAGFKEEQYFIVSESKTDVPVVDFNK